MIPLGFEPKTHSLEGCCSNPTELRNQHCHFSLASAKVILFGESTKYFGIFFSFISILRKFFIARASSSIIFKAFALTGRRAKTTKNPGCYPGDVWIPLGVPADLQSAVKKVRPIKTGGFVIPQQKEKHTPLLRIANPQSLNRLGHFLTPDCKSGETPSGGGVQILRDT